MFTLSDDTNPFLDMFDGGHIKSDQQLLEMLRYNESNLFDILAYNNAKEIIQAVYNYLTFNKLAPHFAHTAIEALSDGLRTSLDTLLEDSEFIDSNIAGTTVVDLANGQTGYEWVMSDYYNNLVEIQDKLQKIFELQYV